MRPATKLEVLHADALAALSALDEALRAASKAQASLSRALHAASGYVSGFEVGTTSLSAALNERPTEPQKRKYASRPDNTGSKYMKLADITKLMGISKSTLHRLRIHEDETKRLPPPDTSFGVKTPLWHVDTIEQYIASQAAHARVVMSAPGAK